MMSLINVYSSYFLLSTLFLLTVADASTLRGDHQPVIELEQQQNDTTRVIRRLQGSGYYYENINLGKPNYDVTLGNPMRGLIGNPDKRNLQFWPVELDASLHLYKRGINEVLLGPNKYDWKAVDDILAVAEQYNSHAIIRWYIHWPDKPLALPEYLTKAPYKVLLVRNEGEDVPFYGDQNLRDAIQGFIKEFGRLYDGDTRLYSIQAGFIGAWGEQHTQGCEYNGDDCAPEYVHEELVKWYSESFKKTKIQFRYPRRVDAFQAGMGYHDDAFTYSTVGGKPNGGNDKQSLFWSMANAFGTSEFWKNAPMGGEVSANNLDVFSPDYPTGKEWHQDFDICSQTTHASYMAWGRGFQREGVAGGWTRQEMNKAVASTKLMGYSFQVDKVSAFSSSNNKIGVDITIRQTGVAPFYYPLNLHIICDGSTKASIPVTGDLTTNGNSVTSRLTDIPATPSCLGALEVKLDSDYLYPGRPIKFAQGDTGKIVLSVPLPDGTITVPPPLPVPAIPIPAPTPPANVPVSIPAQSVLPPAANNNNNSPTNSKRDDIQIENCFLVCADVNTCIKGIRMGRTILQISDGMNISLQSTAGSTKLGLRCDVPGPINEMVIIFDNETKKQPKRPWSIGKAVGFKYSPVEYLSKTGSKEVTFQALDKQGDIITERTLTFTIEA